MDSWIILKSFNRVRMKLEFFANICIIPEKKTDLYYLTTLRTYNVPLDPHTCIPFLFITNSDLLKFKIEKQQQYRL